MGSASESRLEAELRGICCCWAAWDGRVIFVMEVWIVVLVWALVGIFWRGSLRRLLDAVAPRLERYIAVEREPLGQC